MFPINPECSECQRFQERLHTAEHLHASYSPDFDGTKPKPKSKWLKRYKEESYRRELAMNLARAQLGLHLAVDHKDENHQRDIGKNQDIIRREGRLSP